MMMVVGTIEVDSPFEGDSIREGDSILEGDSLLEVVFTIEVKGVTVSVAFDSVIVVYDPGTLIGGLVVRGLYSVSLYSVSTEPDPGIVVREHVGHGL